LCAVRKAVEDGDIAPTRYESYLHITEELRSAEKQGK
jgi:putative ribosome biogenesis GTPase RsgA